MDKEQEKIIQYLRENLINFAKEKEEQGIGYFKAILDLEKFFALRKTDINNENKNNMAD